MGVPYTFATATTSIPLSQLDANFASPITLGNVAMTLSNTYTSIGNLTLTNVTISSTSTPITVPQGGTGLTSLTAGYIPYGNGTSAFSSSSSLYFDGTNLGIGTSSPANKLDIQSTTGVVGRLNNTGNTNDTYWEAKNTFGDVYFGLGGTGAYIYTASSIPIQFYTTGSERMRIDSSGNVGIGITNPASFSKLTVNGGLAILANGSMGVYNSDNTNFFYLNNAGASGANNAVLTFSCTNKGELMRLDSSGNLLVGTTSTNGKISLSASGSAPAISLLYSGTGGFPIEAQTTNASYNGPGVRSRVTNLAAGGSYQAFSYYNDSYGNYMFFVFGNGNVQNTNNSYAGISDAKLKENIVDATPKLSDLMKVQVRQYNFKSDPNKVKQLGVVSQELESIFPGMIEESVDKDVNGNDLGTTTKSVKYSVFVPMLIKAIQEQQAIIEQLKAKVGL